MAETAAGKIPTWALVLGTGIGLVFYAQREFMPRSESNLISERRNEQMEALVRRDDELARAIKDVAQSVADTNRATLHAIETHASKASHQGTAEQTAAILNYLIAQSANQRQMYAVVQSLAQKQNIPAPPLVEVPIPQTTFPR